MQDKLLTEFPGVSYEAWRAQVDKDLKGADFEKRLLSRTLEGIVVQPLYTARDLATDAGGEFAGLPPYRRGPAAVGRSGRQWDLRVEQRGVDASRAAHELAEDLAAGATSIWLRFDAQTRTGDATRCEPDGLPCEGLAKLDTVLSQVDLAQTPVALDAGGNVAVAALYLALAERKDADPNALRGSLGCDPLGALARDGRLPFDLKTAGALLGELCRLTAHSYPQLTAAEVDVEVYQLAGAHAAQELGYALATGCEYLRFALAAGLSIDQASAQLTFRVGVGSDLFLELAKLRALRLAWAKLVAAFGGSDAAQNTRIHAISSLRTKTRRDPWVNMLRTTTEAFSAMVGGADALSTRGFDVALGRSDEFARRIARNAQVILNEEAHVTQVADAAGGSYYVEALTDQLARAGWQSFQVIEQRGGMSAALASGAIAEEVSQTARARNAAIAKRSAPITGVSEFANLGEEPVRRELPNPRPLSAAPLPPETASAALEQLRAAAPGARVAAALSAARQGASMLSLTLALAGGGAPQAGSALPVRRNAEPFEALRDRAERHAASTGQAPRAFLCNLGEIPKHKARASYATGLLNAGGVSALDNDGFVTLDAALTAFSASGCDTVVICGSDDQYPEWVPKLAPELRLRGARQLVLAGRPGDNQSAYERAGITSFIYMGVDVIATLNDLLDRMGVAS